MDWPAPIPDLNVLSTYGTSLVDVLGIYLHFLTLTLEELRTARK